MGYMSDDASHVHAALVVLYMFHVVAGQLSCLSMTEDARLLEGSDKLA